MLQLAKWKIYAESIFENAIDIWSGGEPGSTVFVPSVVGLMIAGEVINDPAGDGDSTGTYK